MALLFFSFLCLLSSHAASPSPGRSAADELALLSFKSVISAGPSDSEGLLASWNTSSHHCSWPGVVCGGRRHPERVVALHLGSSNLSGLISPSLGNMSFLRELDLRDNRLVGEIPPELGRLSKLRLLNLSVNSLHGSIPVAIGRCTNLTNLSLRENHLQEYGAGNMASTNGDVYSYGILVLETVTGKRPMDRRFRQGLSLRECVEQALHHHAMMDVVDARLCLNLENELQTMDDSSSKRKLDCLISLLRLGMSCSQEMPSSRMSTGDIIKELHAIKESLW